MSATGDATRGCQGHCSAVAECLSLWRISTHTLFSTKHWIEYMFNLLYFSLLLSKCFTVIYFSHGQFMHLDETDSEHNWIQSSSLFMLQLVFSFLLHLLVYLYLCTFKFHSKYSLPNSNALSLPGEMETSKYGISKQGDVLWAVLCRFYTKYQKVAVIQCYAPTKRQGKKWRLVWTILERTGMGKQGVGAMNGNREQFSTSFAFNHLDIGGSVFPHKRVPKPHGFHLTTSASGRHLEDPF